MVRKQSVNPTEAAVDRLDDVADAHGSRERGAAPINNALDGDGAVLVGEADAHAVQALLPTDTLVRKQREISQELFSKSLSLLE